MESNVHCAAGRRADQVGIIGSAGSTQRREKERKDLLK